MSVFVEVALGVLTGAIYGGVASVVILCFSLIFRYLTGEKFPSLMGMALGLGILGIGGGLLAILDRPTLEGVVEVLVAAIVIVRGVNMGNRLADKMPRGRASFLNILRRMRKPSHVTIKLPSKYNIHHISGKPRVPEGLKSELSEKEVILPSDLPQEELINRLKRRLITDWGIGSVELELDEDGKVIYLAVAAKEQGISETIPIGHVAIPIQCDRIPYGLAAEDFVRVYLEDGEIIDQVEVKGMDKAEKTVTILINLDLLEKVKDKRASLITGLPRANSLQQ